MSSGILQQQCMHVLTSKPLFHPLRRKFPPDARRLLNEYDVDLSAILLKPNMILPGNSPACYARVLAWQPTGSAAFVSSSAQQAALGQLALSAPGGADCMVACRAGRTASQARGGGQVHSAHHDALRAASCARCGPRSPWLLGSTDLALPCCLAAVLASHIRKLVHAAASAAQGRTPLSCRQPAGSSRASLCVLCQASTS